MNHKIRATIEEFSMLRQGDTVTAAVSGGADSVALLDFLCSLVDLKLTVRACHLNHGLRGAESDRDERLVRTMCEQYGIPLEVRYEDVRALAGERKVSIEVAARDARYSFFEEQAVRYGGKVATAHTLSDTAETVLLNLARGTGITGMCGIPPVRGYLIRPLVACTRGEVEEYCAVHGLCYVTDSTNLTDDYTRNHIRHNILPLFDRVNTGTLEAIGRMTNTLRRDADCLNQLAAQEAAACVREDGYDAIALSQRHPAVRSRVIAGMLAEAGIERSAERISLIDSMLGEKAERHIIQVGRRCYVTVRDGILRLEHRVKADCEPIEPQMLHKRALDGACIALGGGKAIAFSVLNCADYEIFDNNTDLVLKNAADYDKIKADVFLRSRGPGDRLRQAGRGCSKSLKKLFNELGLPDRDRLCVLADADGVFFAEAVGVDERVRVDAHTKRVITFVIGCESPVGKE